MASVSNSLTNPGLYSFANSNYRPPTCAETPVSDSFPSPVFETPKPGQGSVTDAGGWTPHFAEEYSVFHSTPGNLRGSQNSFVDFRASTPSSKHKRLLSNDTFAAEIATHVNHFSDQNLPLPPVEPSRRLASSPNSVTVPQEYITDTTPLPSPDPAKHPQSSKKARKAGVRGAEPSQTATPPPTGRRGARKLADKLNMQNDQYFGQPDFTGNSQQQQQHDIAALMASSGDMFAYPMTAPAATPNTFWDPSMGMDFDFSASPSNVFQTTPVQHGHHRHTGSFDWNSEVPLFQDPNAPFASAGSDPMQTMQRDRPLAPKPMGSAGVTTASAAMSAALSAPLDDPFGLGQSMNGVNPGLLFEPPHNSVLDNPALIPVTQAGSAEATIFQSRSRTPLGENIRQSTSMKDLRATKAPDRALAPSPVKANPRPGMGRSFSENRGKRAQPQNRPVLPKLAPARPVSQASNGSISDNAPPNRPIAKSTGRLSPMKSQHRLSGLASIPEGPALQHQSTRTAVKFTIDSRGRARAETTIVPNEWDWEPSTNHPGLTRDRSRTPRDLGPSDDDESSSDDEPIIIPSRNNSFNASFALPDPLRPVGSIFHSSRRSVSDRSTSSIHDTIGGSQHDADSENETMMYERKDKIGDAASELRKVMEDRRKRSNPMGRGQHRSFQGGHFGPFRGDSNSPSTLTESSLITDRHVRCLCNRKGADEGDGSMIQCSAARPEWTGPLRQKPAYGVYWYGPDLGMVGQQQRSSKQGRAFFSLSCFALIANQLHSLKTNPKRWQVEPLKPSYGPFSSDSLSAPSMPMAPLTDETIAAAKSADAVLLGGPECGNGAVRPEPGLLKLRKGMDIYGKLWPCFFASGSLVDACLPEASVCCGTVLSSSLYTPALFTLASVNSGSDETQNLTPIPRLGVLTIWLGSLPVVAATRRWDLLTRLICLRRKVMTETFEEVFLILRPSTCITPSIGLLPSANLSHILDIKGVPKLFGTILSVAMILCYSLNLPVEAKAVEGVIRMALEGGLHAKDLGGNTTTEEVGDAVFQELEKIPKA
ncbi:hypothetical protein CEK26_006451 [Fusarium fujikuroi]|uniref:Uncharacterized protein n=1 Tax=Fusarium fujikuroi TaxID=5127 RepID=A0A5Q3D7Q0_FUSFU|nr:hypothetical protein CEK27_006458 [Fusarium fujikuroi]QGI79654.1 hypothetical protein CEK25_006383 [Fusarium fujikuroi]QGI93382.1 hypothetical protein CEK26_006451 [Fusarium fujikuroi]VTT63984.1 unnamed protein product [Fusarium fujikuroi]VTT78946.1 unnamed protein product [Fusarium fujikuroi]